MKSIYLISNGIPTRYYKAYQEGSIVKLKESIKDRNNIMKIAMISFASIEGAMSGIKRWVENGKGRIVPEEELCFIEEFDVLLDRKEDKLNHLKQLQKILE